MRYRKDFIGDISTDVIKEHTILEVIYKLPLLKKNERGFNRYRFFSQSKQAIVLQNV